jgi:ABC-type multidrug transport system fused ATPase/permease subunit
MDLTLKSSFVDKLSPAYLLAGILGFKQDVPQLLYRLTKEAWGYERRQASLWTLGRVLSSVLRYISTYVDAKISTRTIMGLQNHSNFNLLSFAKLVLLKICLIASQYTLNSFSEKTKSTLSINIEKRREIAVLEAYFKIPFGRQTQKSTIDQVKETSGKLRRSGVYFIDTINVICDLVETCMMFGVVSKNLTKLSPLLATVVSAFAILHTAKAIYVCRQPREDEVWGFKSVNERQVFALRALPFAPYAMQDFVLHGAKNWFLNTYKKELQLYKPREWKTPTQKTLDYTIDLVQSFGISTLALFFGFKVDLEMYNFVEKNLAVIGYKMESLNWSAKTFTSEILPFAKDYFACLALKDSKPDDESFEDGIGAVEVLEVKSVSFQYGEDGERDDKDNTETFEDENIPVSATSSSDDDFQDTTDFSSDEKLECDDDSVPDRLALDDFSFRFELGKVYSIVGKKGSGKSTLTKILTKLLVPTKGQVIVNDVDLAKISTTEWLKQLAVCPQEFSALRNHTVRDNIGLGFTPLLLNDPDDIIGKEAQVNGVTEFTTLDTIYGDISSSKTIPGFEKQKWTDDFSGGEWQTIALARTFVRKSAKVYLLDEPSSALDPLREHALFERLQKEKAERITIFISHRLQTCRASDCILVMEKGKLVQTGSHSELLLEEEGVYAQLYRRSGMINLMRARRSTRITNKGHDRLPEKNQSTR